jgi:alpha-N-acetylglucosamine transferase
MHSFTPLYCVSPFVPPFLEITINDIKKAVKPQMQPPVPKRRWSLDKVIASTLCVIAGAIFLTSTTPCRGRGFDSNSSHRHIFASSFYATKGNNSNSSSLEPLLDLPLASPLSTKQPTRYAYVFYAAEDMYACSALVNMARLKRFGLPPNVDLIMIAHDTVSMAIQQAAQEKFGALIYETKSFGEETRMGSPIGSHSGYYQHCFQKLMVFLLPDDVYRRVILMDADSLILRPPYHLFQLPDELPFALPKGYWLRPVEDKLTSWFMSVSRRKKGPL